MMCYRDKTFCPFCDCSKFAACPSALTDDVRLAAANWWGGWDVPIAQWADKPTCYEVTP